MHLLVEEIKELNHLTSQPQITTTRFNDEYNAKRSSSYRYYRPPVPPRRAASPPEPSSPPRASPSSPSSPSRKVLTDFKPFSAGAGMSVQGTSLGGTSPPPAPATTPGSPPGAAFSGSSSLSAFGLRSHAPGSAGASAGAGGGGGGINPETTDVSNEALSGVELKLAGISFEQARKLTMMSAWQARS